MTKRRTWPVAVLATALAASAGGGGTASAGGPLVGDAARASRAQQSTLELDVAAAREVLAGVDTADPLLAIERGRLAIYEGDCDAAASILSRPDLASAREAAELIAIAQGCSRATAGTLIVDDQDRGVWVRLQDDEDRALVPLLAETARRAREAIAKDLGVTLPSPLRIDLVRDHFTLAAMTGLPEQAARTTGTVAVAKWGRVIMITPRAMRHGYPWLDTLAHEITHLALSRGTRDKAPLWLQEGVAKREETRWRDPEPLDDLPTPDAFAAVGMEKGLGVELDKIGPSIALLPTPERAAVAFSQVASFIRFWALEAGDEALPKLVVRLKELDENDSLDRAMHDSSGADFTTWVGRWKSYLGTIDRSMPSELAPGGRTANVREVAKRVRLGQLLFDRGHGKHAATQLARAHALMPHDASVRCYLAESLVAGGDLDHAAPYVEDIGDVHGRFGRWFGMNALLHEKDAGDVERAFRFGLALDPLWPAVACENRGAPELPGDPVRAALCEAARRVPR